MIALGAVPEAKAQQRHETGTWSRIEPHADAMTDDAEPLPSPPILHHHQPDALKPNPHPYPIKTTSTGVLSRSNSTTKSTSPYQYYVPQSPNNKDGQKAGGMERRGGRHKYSKSLTSDSVPSPLPVPPAGNGNDSSSSLPSDADVEGGGLWLDRKPRRATVSVLEAADGEGGSGAGAGRKRAYRTIGRRTGGKVKGMVASFERSASRSEDSDSDGGVRRCRGRPRSGSDAGHPSAGSSCSSFSTASLGPFPPDVVVESVSSMLKVGLFGMVINEAIHI